MKKTALVLSLFFLMIAVVSCSKIEEKEILPVEVIPIQELNFTDDYTDKIKAEIEDISSTSSSLQEELQKIEELAQKYGELTESAMTQTELNTASLWKYVIWDTELNSLWSRFSALADHETKERVLTAQKNWIAMKEEVTELNLGIAEENGSMYPLLVNSLWEEYTRRRVYYLANELAKVKEESLIMPDIFTNYGTYVDHQETGMVYSSLVTRQNLEGQDEAVISIYRVGTIEGTFEDHGEEGVRFTSYDETVKGVIYLNGWEGASFEVSEAADHSFLSINEKFEFPFVF